MNVYDFDGTIYNGDSSIDFFKFVAKREPAILKKLPSLAKGVLKYIFKQIDKKALKEHYFSFLSLVDGGKYAELFWEEHKGRICKWYLAQQSENDVIISASPEFLLAPICKELGIKNLIASKVNVHTGKFLSPNCKGEEKVKLFKEIFPDSHIDNFYSDSESDLPLAREAENAYFVKNSVISVWKL